MKFKNKSNYSIQAIWILANSILYTLLAIYHHISNACSKSNCLTYCTSCSKLINTKDSDLYFTLRPHTVTKSTPFFTNYHRIGSTANQIVAIGIGSTANQIVWDRMLVDLY